MTTTTTTEQELPKTGLGEELAKITNQGGAQQDTALAVKDAFTSFCEQADQWTDKALALKVTDISQRAEMKEARESRLALRQIRLGIEKKHAEIKADALARCRIIDGAKKMLVDKIKPLEDHLKEQEDFAEREMERIMAEKEAKRREQLKAETDTDPDTLNLKEMTDDQFAATLQQGKDARTARLEREKREEEERIAKEKAEAEERERIRKENERLKAEAEERERRIAEERKQREEEERKQREEQARKEAEERAKREAEEAARKEAERKAEEARQAKHRKVLARQLAMREVNGPSDYEELAAMSDTDFEARKQAATEAYEAEQERKRKEEEAARKEAKEERKERERINRLLREKEEAEVKERARVEAEAKAKREAEAAEQRKREQALEASVKSAAGHAALIVIETAEAWADKHPDVEHGRAVFVDAVCAILEGKGGAE